MADLRNVRSIEVLVLLLGLTAFPRAMVADLPIMPHAYASVSPSGATLLVLTPDFDAARHVRGKAVVYSIGRDGSMNESWRSTTEYSEWSYISDDGISIVEVFPSIMGQAPDAGDVGIMIFRKDKLIKLYHVNELVKNPKLIQSTISFYSWVNGDKCSGEILGNDFVLKIASRTSYRFDLETGALK